MKALNFLLFIISNFIVARTEQTNDNRSSNPLSELMPGLTDSVCIHSKGENVTKFSCAKSNGGEDCDTFRSRIKCEDPKKNTTCKCTEEYASTNNCIVKCDYVRKTRTKAMVLELFTFFGAGHIYVGNKSKGVIKMIAFCFGFSVICLFPATTKYVSEKCHSEIPAIFVALVFFSYCLGLGFWYLGDLILFYSEERRDIDGFPML